MTLFFVFLNHRGNNLMGNGRMYCIIIRHNMVVIDNIV